MSMLHQHVSKELSRKTPEPACWSVQERGRICMSQKCLCLNTAWGS